MNRRFARTAYALGLLGLSLTAVPASAELVVATTIQDFIISFDTSAPGVIQLSRALQGLANNESIIGLDVRPATGVLYGLGSFGNVYTIDRLTGLATPAISLRDSVTNNPVQLNGSNFGIDFNPVPDRLRIMSNADQNLRVNVTAPTLNTIQDGAVNYIQGTDANIIDVAYSNNVAGATSTTLYGIDAGLGRLVVVTTPNSGTATTALGGPLGFDINELGGFDISGATGNAFAALNRSNESQSRLFQINLTTGLATDLGQVGGGPILNSFAIVAIPEPASLALLTPAGLLLARRRR